MPSPNPLFIADMATVKAGLRLTGTTPGTDALAMIENSVRAARIGFYRRLDAARIATIVALPHVEDPTTADGNLRMLAEITEYKWIRMEIMRIVPTFFYDSTPQVQQEWNDEGMLRGMTDDRIQAEIVRLEEDIEAAIEVLRGTDSIPDGDSKLSVSVISPEPPVRRPGDSILGGYRPWC